MLAIPGGEIADAGEGDQRGEVPVALRILDEERCRMTIDHELGADEGTHAGAARFADEADHATQIGGVGEANGRILQPGGALDQRLGRDGAVAEGEGSMGAQLDEQMGLRRWGET